METRKNFELHTSRITQYLKDRYKESFFFDTLSDDYLNRDKRLLFLKGVDIPFRAEDLKDFKKGLSIARMGENMLFLTGMDPEFPYVEQYREFLRICFDARVREAFLHDGAAALNNGDYLRACCLFRGVYGLILSAAANEEASLEEGANRSNDALAQSAELALRDAMFGYANACSDMSVKLEEPAHMDESDEESRAREEKCGRFKAEGIALYEDMTFRFPEYSAPWYFLAYAYLNMGLYAKASLTFREFLKFADPVKEKDVIEEVEQRVEQLKDPIEVEKGVNAILSGRTKEGIAILESYTDTPSANWWPMHYYLGIAYLDEGEAGKAENAFLRVLKLVPSNIETMNQLVGLYEAIGNCEKAEKYRKKIALLQ